MDRDAPLPRSPRMSDRRKNHLRTGHGRDETRAICALRAENDGPDMTARRREDDVRPRQARPDRYRGPAGTCDRPAFAAAGLRTPGAAPPEMREAARAPGALSAVSHTDADPGGASRPAHTRDAAQNDLAFEDGEPQLSEGRAQSLVHFGKRS